MSKLWFVLLMLLTAVLSACGGREDQTVEIILGEPFTVRIGQTAVLAAEELRLTFESVVEDTRCPTNVECEWSGEARPLVIVHHSENDSTSLDFNTNPFPDLTVEQFTVRDYLIRMEALDPYPDDIHDPIEPEEYRLTLLITKAE